MKEDWEKLPLFHKAQDILTLVEHLVKAVEQTDIEFEEEIQVEMLQHHLEYLKKNAMTIPAKIAGVASEDTPYDLRMENAAIIRKAARELITDARGLQMHGYKDEEYLDLLWNEVEEFRILFAEWVKSFDQWNYIIDRWGLFNPPGVNYDDQDPDDDLPFNPEDFFDKD
ncbi:MAG: hypothetical protein CMC05_04235 [Flavobacteriaceae bacterium]|nr:hypothetical protein [Flavobacteriaceae bacterium]MBD09539.1 hypothetical protein [Flavobacteriaceae bacterium]|tara:strand:+ start:54 stop:560 length:507 start_codon:yes stop_codon:yes gene_type:complete